MTEALQALGPSAILGGSTMEEITCQACKDGLELMKFKLCGNKEAFFHVVPWGTDATYPDSGMRCTEDCCYFIGCECQKLKKGVLYET